MKAIMQYQLKELEALSSKELISEIQFLITVIQNGRQHNERQKKLISDLEARRRITVIEERLMSDEKNFIGLDIEKVWFKKMMELTNVGLPREVRFIYVVYYEGVEIDRTLDPKEWIDDARVE